MKFLSLAFLIISFSAFSQNECGDKRIRASESEYHNLETNLAMMREVKATDLKWREGSEAPKEVFEYTKKHDKISINYFARFDLNKDGVDEIIIRSSTFSGSGGQGFMFLERQNGKWTELISFTGGFVLSQLDVPKTFNQKYYTITQWRRFGNADTRQSFLAYKNHKYQFISEQPVPLTVIYSKEFQRMLLDINWMCWATWN